MKVLHNRCEWLTKEITMVTGQKFPTLPPTPPRHPFSTYFVMIETSYVKQAEISWRASTLKRLGLDSATEFLDSKHFGKGAKLWKISFFKTNRGELAVACRGTDNLQNIGGDIAHGITPPKGLLREMEKAITDMERKTRLKLKVLTGHSEGGFFADRLFEANEKIERLTLNAHDARKGPNRYHFRLHGDPISKGFISERSNYYTLGKHMGHRTFLSRWKKHLLEPWKEFFHKTWPQIIPKHYR